MTPLLKTLSLVVFLVFIGNTVAHAHKVTIFAWVEGDRIFTESKFSGGKKVKNGKVTVFDSHGHQVLEGRTDNQGAFVFKTPRIDDLTLVLNAGMGHRNSWKLSAAELGAPGADPAAELPPTPMAPKTQTGTSPVAAAGGLTAQTVEAIVARQLEQKLQPLTRMMASAQDKGPGAGDIFGGIGYILGLVGLGAYVHYRKENRQS